MNIKDKINRAGLRQWEIAEKMNISEFTLSRWMRRPENLSEDKLNDINDAIIELKSKKKE
jgi:transposase